MVLSLKGCLLLLAPLECPFSLLASPGVLMELASVMVCNFNLFWFPQITTLLAAGKPGGKGRHSQVSGTQWGLLVRCPSAPSPRL